MEAIFHVGADISEPGNQTEALLSMNGFKKLLLVGLTAGVFSSSVTWALRENAWLVLPVFLVTTMAVGWFWAAKYKRKWKDAALENTVNVTREAMFALLKCQSREEFIVLCAVFCLDPKLLMKNYPFFKWED